MFKSLKHKRKSYLRVGSSSDSEQDDTNFYRCNVCGFVCNSEKVNVMKGNQSNRDSFESGITYPVDSDGDYYVEISSDSCPSCGSYFSRN